MQGLTVTWVRAALLAGLACVAGGCDGRDDRVVEYCTERCDCGDCPGAEQEECEIERQGRIDVATVYGCEEQYLAYLDCYLDEASCEGEGDTQSWGVTCTDKGCPCDSKKDKYDRCVEKADKMKTDDVIDL